MEDTSVKPKWLRRRLPPPGRNATVHAAIQGRGLHTVCVEACCPNQMECFGRGTATFLLLGPSCTRGCTFCAVDKSPTRPPDPDEPARIAAAVAQLELNFCVLTMVTRDDLADGGAEHIAETVSAIRKARSGIGLELLISDLHGSGKALFRVLEARPEVLNHNVETVPRLYPEVRPQADFNRSLELLQRASSHNPPIVTKSGMMLGLGETRKELIETMQAVRDTGCRLLTLGQYLAPSKRHHPIVRYVPPEEFSEYEKIGLGMGFSAVASAPFVRSSYEAERLYREAAARIADETD
ncbi:MAG: lipoyl synthase [Deltaproteobacteria bacterium HGW-Deltaproteobacteria-15]|nr:MAG: lipoyl synthase [Deltaproteobacteria bacterium HGW-Deltaproteobacteria-15]